MESDSQMPFWCWKTIAQSRYVTMLMAKNRGSQLGGRRRTGSCGRVRLAGQRHHLSPPREARTVPAAYGGHMKQEYDFSKGKRGAVVPVPASKTRVTIRLDADILDWFRNEVDKAGGGNYQSLINLALRDFVSPSPDPLENTLSRAIREELRTAGKQMT